MGNQYVFMNDSGTWAKPGAVPQQRGPVDGWHYPSTLRACVDNP
jgi:hypothetical protein